MHILCRLSEKTSGSVEKLYTSEYRESAKKYFLNQFNRCYSHEAELDLEYCQNFLHKKMLEKQSLLNEVIHCFVTTLHSGTNFFQYLSPSQKDEAMSNFIDLLIIDEAGQVMPAVAGALISVAKKALLVGDVKQIEPIFALPGGIDLANAKKFGLCGGEWEYEQLKQMGILCSGDAQTQYA